MACPPPTSAELQPAEVDATPNPQLQSPLFGVLTADVRNKIFDLVLIEYATEVGYRPGFKAPPGSMASTGLLETCKRAYAEGQHLFQGYLERAFWFELKGRSDTMACINFFKSLSPQQVHNLRCVRLFTEISWLEEGFNLHMLMRLPNFRPEVLTIAIRCSDWWFWEDEEQLTMKEDWLYKFEGPPGLKKLKVEYETLSWKREEMMEIVRRNKKWKLALRGDDEEIDQDVHLSAEKTELEEWTWVGPSRLGGRECVVVTDTWKFVGAPMMEGEKLARGPGIEGQGSGGHGWLGKPLFL